MAAHEDIIKRVVARLGLADGASEIFDAVPAGSETEWLKRNGFKSIDEFYEIIAADKAGTLTDVQKAKITNKNFEKLARVVRARGSSAQLYVTGGLSQRSPDAPAVPERSTETPTTRDAASSSADELTNERARTKASQAEAATLRTKLKRATSSKGSGLLIDDIVNPRTGNVTYTGVRSRLAGHQTRLGAALKGLSTKRSEGIWGRYNKKLGALGTSLNAPQEGADLLDLPKGAKPPKITHLPDRIKVEKQLTELDDYVTQVEGTVDPRKAVQVKKRKLAQKKYYEAGADARFEKTMEGKEAAQAKLDESSAKRPGRQAKRKPLSLMDRIRSRAGSGQSSGKPGFLRKYGPGLALFEAVTLMHRLGKGRETARKTERIKKMPLPTTADFLTDLRFQHSEQERIARLSQGNQQLEAQLQQMAAAVQGEMNPITRGQTRIGGDSLSSILGQLTV